MNKTIVSILISFGLLLINTPDAAADDRSWSAYRVPAHQRFDPHCRDHRHALPARTSSMPRWLKEDRSFRHWYKHSRLQREHYLSWHEVFEIYRWENSRDRHRRTHNRIRY